MSQRRLASPKTPFPEMVVMLDFMPPLTIGATATEKTMLDRRPLLSPSRAA
jgi:hypothetical protein